MAIFAILDAPFAATRRHIAANEKPPAYVDRLVERAYLAFMAPEATNPPG